MTSDADSAGRQATGSPASDMVMMSRSGWERQALGSIAGGLADSDPTLASMLNIFSRLAPHG